ncbi:ATP-binding protein [Agreia sp. Leaf335]|uniref:DUF3107 domain-containing protein n=1 Tax=Agreia sp. Leaf335 TaxID=1736340 RepID=UPI0006F56B56|nr:DUF3107 domain-containing protein [Agreia sp. Leaf335]KQR22358.1 ATP-binding protein [Agreia sp. Leaf335]
MDIRIGIAHSPREISFESGQSPADIEKAVAEVLSGASSHLSLTDVKGTVYLVPATTLSYVEIGAEEARRVGFVL